MHISCGTDVIEIERIKDSIERLGDSFKDRIYTQREIEYCESKHRMKYQHYAARFAAKEAIFKAVSNLLEDKYQISWLNAEIINDDKGKPEIKFLDINLNRIKDIDISISHCKQYAIATVIVMYE